MYGGTINVFKEYLKVNYEIIKNVLSSESLFQKKKIPTLFMHTRKPTLPEVQELFLNLFFNLGQKL